MKKSAIRTGRNFVILCLLIAFSGFIMLSLWNPELIVSILSKRNIHTDSEISSYLKKIKEKDREIELLKASLSLKQSKVDANDFGGKTNVAIAAKMGVDCDSSNAMVQEKTAVLESNLETFCESKYGLRLIDNWRERGESWCESEGKSVLQPRLKCYPYHQEHKKLDGRGPDMFCEANDFFIDFSKVHGRIYHEKSRGSDAYLSFDPGSLFSSCHRTALFNNRLFMPHHNRQMQSFEADRPDPSSSTYTVVSHPTYLLARDEDCENTFHSTADFMNMLLVARALNIDVQQQQVVLFDNHPDGPYTDLIKTAYSPKHPLLRVSEFGNKVVLFKHLIFHLESPAGLIFPRVANPDPLRCQSTSFFQYYRKFILSAFNIYDVQPPPIPTITLSLRHRSKEKNVGRVLANENEVISMLQQGNLVNVNVIDSSKIPFREQLIIIRNTNILVGVHGAGLMLIMFAAEEAVLVEIHPSYRQDRHFRHASRMTGKIYMPVRSMTRETCVGSSDNVVAPLVELRAAIDGAVRIARNFDDGISECGLVCPTEILAIDHRLDIQYKAKEKRGPALDLHFPC